MFKFDGYKSDSTALKKYKDHRVFRYFQNKHKKNRTGMIKRKILHCNAVV